MDKIRIKHVLLFLILLLVMSRGVIAIIESKKQQYLAQRLGVEINAYPPTSAFPINYFVSELEPGVTTIKEVHAIVKQYERVLHCRKYAEIYYYFSNDDNAALRFQIFYDENGKYSKIIGEDDDSATLYTAECVPGLLSEKEY